MTNETPAEPTSARWHVFKNLLNYVRAMRTASVISPDEAAEWVALEQEFTTRCDEIKNAA